ncbi:MAG: integrase [Ruminococcaceae bacterium]|nr:integrase [Oscillospiraceae bacterium]
MEQRFLAEKQINAFGIYLRQEEKSEATVEKYLRDVGLFCRFADSREVTKELVVAWKRGLSEQGYAVRSINSMLASLNSFFAFLGWQDCRVKNIRLQRQTYCAEERELTKAEYLRLLAVAQKNPQLNLVLQTICGTGIRVSELKYFTVESVRQGQIVVSCKNKTRTIFVPGKLKKLLLNYAKQKNIRVGEIFVGRNGKPLDRSSILRQMKALCRTAGVKETKVFPHNLRKLFARTFYGIEKDIAKLADILGHSSINTTRIYIMTTGTEHRHKNERLGLVI